MNTTTQQIPTGYKQTEIGIIPADWELVSYDQAFNFLKTASYSRAQLGTNGKIRYIHYGDIHMKWNFFVDLKQDLPTINEEKAIGYSLIEDGDVVMADASEDYGGIGKSVEVVNKDNINAISGLHTFLLRDKGDYFVSGFRGYIHSINYVKSSMDRLATGLKVYGVSKTNLKLVQIPRPPPPEQKAIANALSNTDELIENLEKLISKKKCIKQGAMQQLLTGKKRLPGFSGRWEIMKMGDVCKITTGRKDVNEGNPSGRFPFFTCSRDFTFSDSFSFDTEAILVAGNGEVGNLHYYKGKFEAYQRTYVLYDFNIDVKYLWYQLNSYLVNSLGIGKIGSSIPYIKKENLVDFVYSSPPKKEEQTAIATVFTDMDAEIENLKAKRDKYVMIKQGMMQQLLTGKIRIYGSN